ncbi:MAG: uracil-DNA glycosylase, partial [Verrucomicrobia bacterium]
MASDFDRLLDATIQHLRELQARGVRHVPVAPETLAALRRPVIRPAARPPA